MTREDLEVLAGFETVWARVRGAREAEPMKADTLLSDTLQRLCWLCGAYSQMSAAARGELKRCLQMLANRTRRMIHLLHLEFFLKTGEMFVSEYDGNFASCTLSNLRKLWQCTVEMQELMQHDTDVFREIGGEMHSQSEVLKKQIARLLP